MASASSQKSPDNVLAPFLTSFREAPAEDVCMAPYRYTKALPGKNTVARFAEALQAWFCLPEESFTVIRDVCEMTLTATLMLDDIEDGSKLRRGCPTASTVYGQSQTINSSNFVFIKGLTKFQALGDARLCEIYANGLQTIGLGQALELDWRHRFQCPRVDQYILMVDNKTGGYFRLISQLMAAVEDKELQPCFIELITLLGRYYQIRDDYQNLASDEYTSTKGFCDDLDEGKYSLPMIHLLENSRAADHIRTFLLNRSPRNEMEPALKKWILSEMRTAGTFDYTTNLLTELHDKMMAVLDECEHKLGPNQNCVF